MPMPIQPLSPMTAALQALLEQQRALDRRELQEPGATFRTPGAREMNLQAIEHLERAMACVAADEPRDAVVQLLVAAGRAQALEQDMCDLPLADEIALLSRLLRSALPVLAKTVDFDLDAFGAPHYGLRKQSDPGDRKPNGGQDGGSEPGPAS